MPSHSSARVGVEVLVSPAEPKPFHALGKLSLRTEELGCDFLIVSKNYGLVGVQRKTVDDLLASLNQSVRFAQEMAQMQALGLGILLIEGTPQWTNEGRLVSRSEFSLAQMCGLLWSVQSMGYWTGFTTSLQQSIIWLSLLPQWLGKAKHRSLLERGKSSVRDEWGQRNSRAWGIWLLQGFAGVGYETAAAIYDHFEGVPLQWTVTMDQLMKVKGVGKGRATSLWKALNTTSSSTPTPRPPEGSEFKGRGTTARSKRQTSASPLEHFIDVSTLTTEVS